MTYHWTETNVIGILHHAAGKTFRKTQGGEEFTAYQPEFAHLHTQLPQGCREWPEVIVFSDGTVAVCSSDFSGSVSNFDAEPPRCWIGRKSA